MIELKPCPFCGGEARLYTSANGVAVVCTNSIECGCRTRWYMDADDFISAWIKTDKVSVESAIEAWNRRVKND